MEPKANGRQRGGYLTKLRILHKFAIGRIKMLADVVACNGVQCIHISVYIFLYTVKQFIFATPLSRGGGGNWENCGKMEKCEQKGNCDNDVRPAC